jgi:hypothetical protein
MMYCRPAERGEHEIRGHIGCYASGCLTPIYCTLGLGLIIHLSIYIFRKIFRVFTRITDGLASTMRETWLWKEREKEGC